MWVILVYRVSGRGEPLVTVCLPISGLRERDLHSQCRARGMCVCRSGLFAPDGLGLSQPADTLSVRELELRLGRNRQQPTCISGITAVEAIVAMNAISGRGLGVRARAHLYLPDFFGKPTFGN
jgi:hypothetical protein